MWLTSSVFLFRFVSSCHEKTSLIAALAISETQSGTKGAKKNKEG